ncbi:MAG: tandem-95 repeat protein, partial [Gammaproteobacteria bacterium]|nr:tandem-95 repeat protein [Gammaproteobacteria bacterium]
MASIRITTLETVGSLQLSGVNVTLNQVITKADIDAGNLKFVPAANANGSSYDSFAFCVNDGTTDSASSYTLTVDVTAVNDAPTSANNTVTTNEDTTYTFTASDFIFSDTEGSTMASIKVTTLETAGALQLSGVDVTLNQVITKADIDAGNLKFVPVANANGSSYDSFAFSVNDGTADSTSSYTLTVDVTAVNDAPTASANTVTTNEDTTYTFTASDFSFNDVDGDTMASIKITTLESVGALQLSGVDVTLNQVISKANIDAGNLKFVPVANANGSSYDSFAFSVNDGTVDSASSYTLTVDVTAVNDAPTAAANTVTTTEDTTYTFSASDFSYSDIDSDTMASVKITTLESVGSLQLSGVDVTLNQVITKADIDAGNLKFVPAANANGSSYDSFAFSVNDGTTDSTSSYTLTVDVTAVNDAPTFMVGDGDGIVTTDLGSNDYGRSVTVQSDGKILVAGHSHNGTDNDFTLTRYNADGSLDTTFGGGDGIVTTDLGSNDYGRSMTVQSDGKILVTGSSHNGTDNDFALIRYNTDGSLDTTFGGGDGIVTTDLGSSNDSGRSIMIQSDGKILVAGDSDNGTDDKFALIRYNTDGSLDTSFGTSGIATTPIGSGDVFVESAVLQSDGKILLAGAGADVTRSQYDIVIVRFNTNGSLDTSFDTDGIVATPFSASHAVARSITVLSDGKILVAGDSIGDNYDFTLARYNADGSLDTSFDGDGILTTAIGAGHDIPMSITVQSDGKILLAGNSSNGTDDDFAMVRYNADGSLDTSFDGDGIVTTAIGAGRDHIRSITVQSDGKIVVTGHSHNGTNDDFALVRYNADGSLDTSFDSVNTLDGTPTFTEGGSAVVLDSNVQISDTELDALGNYNGASLTLVRNGGTNSKDQFSETGTLSALTASGNLVVGGTTIGTVTTNSGGTLVLTFNSSATSTLINSAMQQIAYSNSSDAPSASVQINWSFDDGNSGSQGTGGALQATGSATVSITAVNDAPTASANTVTTNEDTTYTFTASDFNFSDVDGDTMASIKVTTLETVGALQLSGVDVTLNQVITKANIDAGNLKFVPVANANGSSYDSFAFSVND